MGLKMRFIGVCAYGRMRVYITANCEDIINRAIIIDDGDVDEIY